MNGRTRCLQVNKRTDRELTVDWTDYGKTVIERYVAPHGLTYLLEHIKKTYGKTKDKMMTAKNILVVRNNSLVENSSDQYPRACKLAMCVEKKTDTYKRFYGIRKALDSDWDA